MILHMPLTLRFQVEALTPPLGGIRRNMDNSCEREPHPFIIADGPFFGLFFNFKAEPLKMDRMFQFNAHESFPAREERVLRFWKKREIFERSLEKNKAGPLFSFYDGPPFATGLPHYGHLLAGMIKDVIPRYKTMKGYFVPRRFGWDCHGLPVENEIEKAKALSGASEIEAFGIGAFNEECRQIVLRYTAEWEKSVDRMGRWVDFRHPYRTMDLPFMESVWWVFQQLYEKGLVYEGLKVMPFSSKLGTPLSNFEANLNYKEVDDPALTVAFTLLEDPKTALLAWTTTPWTLPSNLALIVGEEIEYIQVEETHSHRCYILAEARLGVYFKDPSSYTVVARMRGAALQGKRYRPLFPFFDDRAKQGAFRVILDGCVSLEEGTGIVHAAPAFGEVDFFACKREGIELVCPVDSNGRFTHEVPPYSGKYVKDADREIARDLKSAGSLFHQGTVRHRYPFCWRSDTPLIYKAVTTWFVAVEACKEKLLAANRQIHWVPSHIQEGRFGKWLEGAWDWAISRNRYWGTPIPIWRSTSGRLKVIGSVRELEEKTGVAVRDLHRHVIDELTFEEGGELYRRIPEVFDCWFESGAMPYAQQHYPFEHREEVEAGFPADFIAEGLDQTRGWFYTLTVLAAALFDQPAFRHVIVNGIILAEDGNKMSKRLKNYPDPELVMDRYGADAIRLYMQNSPAVRAEDLRFSEKGVEQVLRQVLIPFWNAFVFLSTYAVIYQWKPKQTIQPPTAAIDRWILSLFEQLIQEVEAGLEGYDLNAAVLPLVSMIDQLTNWYIRRSRGRFWAEEATQDRDEAFETLYTVLLGLTRVMAPFIPFLSEAIYQELREESAPESVHLTAFPTYDARRRDRHLEKEMAAVQRAVSLGHSVRKEHRLKVRQPLAQAYLITSDPELLRALREQSALIAEELNVKTILVHEEEGDFVRWSLKPNFPVLGKKVGSELPRLKAEIEKLSQEEVRRFAAGQGLQIGSWQLTSQDVIFQREVKAGLAAHNEGNLTVVLDTTLTEELLLEGLARELVNKINSMRRDLEFAVTDRIRLRLATTPRVREAFSRHYEYIVGEVLAVEVLFQDVEGPTLDLNGEPTILELIRK